MVVHETPRTVRLPSGAALQRTGSATHSSESPKQSYGGKGRVAIYNGVVLAAAPVYGSFAEPVDFGSGGGSTDDAQYRFGGAGGGALRLRAEAVQLGGAIVADGGRGGGGGGCGSGGSIHLTVGSLTGQGSIQANGQVTPDNWGASGGGQAAIFYRDMSGFTGSVQAKGGRGNAYNAGAGTVFLKKNTDTFGELLVDNDGTETTEWSTPLLGVVPVALKRLSIGGSARVDAIPPVHLSEGTVVIGTSYFRFSNGSTLSDLSPQGSNHLSTVGAASFRDVTISDAASLTLTGPCRASSVALRAGGALRTTATNTLELVVTNTVLVESNSTITATGSGYPGSSGAGTKGLSGPGVGADKVNCAGYGGAASHGGIGGITSSSMAGAPSYGSFTEPATFGSGGGSTSDCSLQPGLPGGGAIMLRA